MVELALAEKAGSVVWNIVRPFAVFIACAAIGFAAAETWEHRGPGPKVFGWSVFGSSLKVQRDGLRDSIPAIKVAAYKSGAADQFKADLLTIDKWSTAFKQSQADLTDARGQIAAAQSRADAYASKQASAAYALGRATCGATNATVPNPLGPGAVAGGLRVPADDFAALFGQSAWTPVPGAAVLPGRVP